MEKTEYRAVIKFFVLDGLSAKEIHKKMVQVLKECAPSFPTVHRWVLEFRRGRKSVEDEPRSGRPKTATTPEIVRQVQNMISKNPSLTKREIADAAGISDERVIHILHEVLRMKKIFGKLVPCSLTVDQKLNRKQISERNLYRMMQDKTDFMGRFVACGETWIYHNDPKAERSARKVMAIVFWDAKGVLLTDYVEKGKTIDADYYCQLLDQLAGEINEKRRGLSKKKIIFQDNAQIYKKAFTMSSKFKELKCELLEHPQYSPDLAVSDFHLFSNLKQYLLGKRFSSNEEAVVAVEQYFDYLPENHFSIGMKLLENQWSKCIELDGDYIS